MKGYKINPNAEHSKLIVEGLLKGEKRTKYTPNEIRVDKKNNRLEMDVYNKFGEYRATAYFSVEDLDLLKKYKWYLDNAGYISTTLENGNKKRFHKFIYDNKGKVVDHINENKLDNTRDNLRECEHWQNRTRAKQYNSKIVGVYKTKNNTYQASIEHRTKRKTKKFKTEEEAIIQRFIWDINYFGEFSPQLDLIKEKYPFLVNGMGKGFKINESPYIIDLIKRIALVKYCPCKIQKIEENKCPCDDFINTGKCCCKLWIKED